MYNTSQDICRRKKKRKKNESFFGLLASSARIDAYDFNAYRRVFLCSPGHCGGNHLISERYSLFGELGYISAAKRNSGDVSFGMLLEEDLGIVYCFSLIWGIGNM
jgi:hypothetical protein